MGEFQAEAAQDLGHPDAGDASQQMVQASQQKSTQGGAGTINDIKRMKNQVENDVKLLRNRVRMLQMEHEKAQKKI